MGLKIRPRSPTSFIFCYVPIIYQWKFGKKSNHWFTRYCADKKAPHWCQRKLDSHKNNVPLPLDGGGGDINLICHLLVCFKRLKLVERRTENFAFFFKILFKIYSSRRTHNNYMYSYTSCSKRQEAHGPQLAHLSETATADMQMACNIFPILLWQGNGLNSFWNILLTRLKCWNF